MAAPIGNQYYLIRSKDGRETIYQPLELLDKANEYFQWCLNNPFYQTVVQKRKISRDEEIVELVEAPKMRPFTLQGFCNFAEISINTFKNYENKDESNEDGKDFLIVTTRIRGIIENQQFEGAASGFLNSNIIARSLGLIDKKETEIKGGLNIPNLPDIADRK